MKKIVVIILMFILLGGIYFSMKNKKSPSTVITNMPTSTINSNSQNIAATSVIAQNLDTPWSIVFLPDNTMLVTERPGRVRVIDAEGNMDANGIQIKNVKEIGEGGLLGITIDPNFSSKHFVYLYYTYSISGDDTLNRVVRMTYSNKKLTEEKIIIDKIPGASNHNGGRIKFGPDKYLYIGTGDAEDPSQAQNKNTLGGKILRVSPEGKVEVYSYGHRNVQGLTWDLSGNLWATEHGRSGITTGYDELNLIQKGNNYGWPEIQGDETRAGMVTAKRNSGATTTWAPSGIAYLNNSLFFGGLRGTALYEAVIRNGEVTDLKEHFKNEFGRIRDVVVGPDNMLYITTSNLDGRGIPKDGDDKIIRINPSKL